MKDYPLDSILQIMKPCKLNPTKTKSHKTRLERILKQGIASGYYAERKIDGISGLSIGGRIFSNVISKVTKLPAEKTHHVPQISDALRQFSDKLILDGELAREGWKSNNVTSITSCKDPKDAIEKQKQEGYLSYYVYDILRDVDGTWLLDVPFGERRAILMRRFRELSLQYSTSYLVLNNIYTEHYEELLEQFLNMGYEGIVLKNKDGLYVPGKRPMWNQIKLKQECEDDVFIIGYEGPTKEYKGNAPDWPYWEDGVAVTEHYYKGLIGSIRIGKYGPDGSVVDVGRVTGLTDELRKLLTEHGDQYLHKVIKIKAMEPTETNKYRHGNFLAFHPDKNPSECRVQENDM